MRSDVTVVSVGRGRALARWRHTLLVVLSAAYLFTLTKGPLFWLRKETAPLRGDFIDDVWIQVTFVAISTTIIACAWPLRERVLADRRSALMLGVFLFIVVSSAWWSEWSGRTLEQATMMILGTAACALIGVSLTVRTWTLCLWAALHAGVGLSIFARQRSWPGVFDINGDLAGVFFNRNSLGPVSVLGAMTSSVLILWVVRSSIGTGGKVVASAALITLMVLDVRVAIWTGSLSPIVAASTAGLGVGLLLLCLDGPRAGLRRALAGVVGAVLIVGLVSIGSERSAIFDGAERVTTLSGRTEIWEVVFDAFRQKPLLGWGFMSLWRDDGFLWMLGERAVIVHEAHSGYFEVLVGTGLVGLIALVVVVGRVAFRVGTRAFVEPTVDSLWAWALVVYVLAVNVTETFIGANLLPWSLLIVALYSAQEPVRATLDGCPATAATVRPIQLRSPVSDAVGK